jgi:hypothetical protein
MQSNAIPPTNNVPIVNAPQYVAPITPIPVASTDNSVDEEIILPNVNDVDTETLGLGDDFPSDVPF